MVKSLLCCLVGCIGISGIIGCSETIRHTFMKNDVNPKGRIAVIIAETKFPDLNKIFADKVESELSKSTTFEVIPQDIIMQKIKDYPERIKGPYKSAGMSAIRKYELTDVDTLNKISAKLKADYLYVVWIPIGTIESAGAGDGKLIYMDTIVQLFEFPTKREIAHAKYIIAWNQGHVIGGYHSPEESCAAYSKAIVSDIAKQTKSQIVQK